MDLDFIEVDIQRQIAECRKLNGTKYCGPGVTLPRAGNEQWLVAMSPVRLDGPIEWSHVTSEELFYVPIIPYQLSAAPERALTFMFALGMRCDVVLGRRVKKLQCVIGCPVEELDPERHNGMGFRYHLGFALLLEN